MTSQTQLPIVTRQTFGYRDYCTKWSATQNVLATLACDIAYNCHIFIADTLAFPDNYIGVYFTLSNDNPLSIDNIKQYRIKNKWRVSATKTHRILTCCLLTEKTSSRWQSSAGHERRGKKTRTADACQPVRQEMATDSGLLQASLPSTSLVRLQHNIATEAAMAPVHSHDECAIQAYTDDASAAAVNPVMQWILPQQLQQLGLMMLVTSNWTMYR